MNEEEVYNIPFIEPGEDTAKSLEAAEKALYFISHFSSSLSYSHFVWRLLFGGTIEIISRDRTNCWVSLPL
jgi:hypothetical protein